MYAHALFTCVQNLNRYRLQKKTPNIKFRTTNQIKFIKDSCIKLDKVFKIT